MIKIISVGKTELLGPTEIDRTTISFSLTNVTTGTININICKKNFNKFTLINVLPVDLELESGSTVKEKFELSRGQSLIAISTGEAHVDLET